MIKTVIIISSYKNKSFIFLWVEPKLSHQSGLLAGEDTEQGSMP